MLSFFAFRGLADPILLTLSLARYFDVLAGCKVAWTVAFVELGCLLIVLGPSRLLRSDPANNIGLSKLSLPPVMPER